MRWSDGFRCVRSRSESEADPSSLHCSQETISAASLARNSFKTTQVGFGQWLWNWVAGLAGKTDDWTIRKWEDDKDKIQLSSALQYGASCAFVTTRSDHERAESS